MLSILIFIVILAVLIFVHELGHFIAAKRAGIRVDEFGIGFPPRIFSRTYGETTYALNLIPFGGYVKIHGENPGEASEDDPRSFSAKPRWVQAIVLVAGVTMNALFAWVLISIGFMHGLPASLTDAEVPQTPDAKLLITRVSPDSPASRAGLKEGDQILFLDAKGDSDQTPSVSKVQSFIAKHAGEEVTVLYKRDGETAAIRVVPSNEVLGDRAAIGVSLDMVGTLKLPVHKAFLRGAEWAYYAITGTASGIWALLTQAIQGQAHLSEVTGPVGIVGLVGDATSLGLVYLLSFTAFISINLAVINLLPFPALDGGRLLFVLIEAVKRSPINPKVAGTLNTVGFVLLLLLMVAVTYNDIIKLVR